MKGLKIRRGSPLELGAHLTPEGANFAVYSGRATSMRLGLFEGKGDVEPSMEWELSPLHNRTGDIWHICIQGAGEGALYGFRCDGPRSQREGHRFDPRRILLDPYARAVTDLEGVPKGVLSAWGGFDWEGVGKPRRSWEETVIYETHIRGLTRHPSSGVEHPGSYRGVIEKIPYFKDLGVTAVEFLPLQEFNHRENPRRNPLTGEILGNYWGYSTAAFFAPKGSYCSSGDCGEQVVEFKEMVRELHRAGLEVILDVVFNHTAEMGRSGPVYSFKGLDNKAYYLLGEEGRRYLNLTGCGNTFNCNHPAAARLIVDCLRYWAGEMMVDGFRFDLAAVFHRDAGGGWMDDSPLIRLINEDPVLREVKLIAEPWDAAGGYMTGRLGGSNWADWNDRYRDEVRRFWRGDGGMAGALATRISGSEDLFRGKGTPLCSVNYITCHDGFTLNDLNSYLKKNNFANGHRNRDGPRENFSRNFGEEGESEDLDILKKRIKQAKNFIATLMLSQGVPMVLGGDEFLRTQKGNNNAYCQDNAISWYDWDLLERNAETHRFFREIIKFRRSKPYFQRRNFFTGKIVHNGKRPDVAWYKPDGEPQDWVEGNHTLGCFINGRSAESGRPADDDIFIIYHSGEASIRFRLPRPKRSRRWRLAVDTSAEPPGDIYLSGMEPAVENQREYNVSPLSVVALVGKKNG